MIIILIYYYIALVVGNIAVGIQANLYLLESDILLYVLSFDVGKYMGIRESEGAIRATLKFKMTDQPNVYSISNAECDSAFNFSINRKFSVQHPVKVLTKFS